MVQKRLEILRDNVWFELELYYGEGLKYNNVINKINETVDRSFSHSNTFQIPWTKKNIDALNLNLFNHTSLANALNEKYEAKYFVDNVLLQEGLVVINNMNNGVPSLNFIDKALSLVELWGSTTYKEFIQDSTLLANVSSIYTDAIDDMRSYDMDPNAVLGVLSNISGKTYPIAYFPNNINAIGDKFQSNSDGTRYDDYFNPYQSRPLFNAQAFLDMVTEAYGYSLIKNTSIDWDKVAVTAMCADKLTQGEVDEGTQTFVYDTVFISNAIYETFDSFSNTWEYQAAMQFPESVGLIPNNITNFPSSPTGLVNAALSPTFFSNRTLFVPNVEGGYSGLVNFQASFMRSDTNFEIYGVYEDTTTANQYIIEAVTVETDNSTSFVIDIDVNKSHFDPSQRIDPNAGEIVGVYVLSESESLIGSSGMFNMTVTEEVLSAGVTTFDDYGQYEQLTVDLTYSTPTKTIKDLINGLLQRFGALIEIDHKNNEVEIFTYDYYVTNKLNGNYVNWTDYLLEYNPPNFNTDYGNNYAIKNKVGLGNAFVGNWTEVYLGNQVNNSKYKEYAENLNSQFNDVSKLISVVGTNNTYDEFSIEGSSLVEYDYASGSFSQRRFEDASGVSQGTITGIPFMTFVSFSQLPSGLSAWYGIIDSSLRCNPTFLLPQKEIRNLDIKKPVYIGKLGGFYIIEEIAEYEDEITPVRVKLIKLPLSTATPQEDKIESIINFYKPGEFFGNTDYYIYSSTTFNDYEPTSATLHAIQYTDSIANGGTATGVTYSEPLTLTTYTNDIMVINFGTSLDSSELGWFQVYVEDDSGDTSDIVEILSEV